MGDFHDFSSPFEDLPGNPKFSSLCFDQQHYREEVASSYALSHESLTPPPFDLHINDSEFAMSRPLDRYVSSVDQPYFSVHSMPTPQQVQFLHRDGVPMPPVLAGHLQALTAAHRQRLGSPIETSSSMSSYDDFSPNAGRVKFRNEFVFHPGQSPVSPNLVIYDDSFAGNITYQHMTSTPCCLQDIQRNPDQSLENSNPLPFETQSDARFAMIQHVSSFAPSSYAEDTADETRLVEADDVVSIEAEDVEEDSPPGNAKTDENDSDYTPDERRKKRPRHNTDLDKSSGSSIRPKKRRSPSTTQHSESDESRHSRTTSMDAKLDRQFHCLLRSYGCTSNFSSKNEWKRHISTQHLCFRVWRCDLCQDSAGRPNDFNRKDLFMQHLKRMHSQGGGAGSPKVNKLKTANGQIRVKGEDGSAHTSSSLDQRVHDLESINKRCLIQIRKPPVKLACVYCTRAFQGPEICEEWLEHVGRHLLSISKGQGASSETGDEAGNAMSWKDDEHFRKWLLNEGMIAREKDRNGWVVLDKDKHRTRESVSKQTSEEDDVDATGDEE